MRLINEEVSIETTHPYASVISRLNAVGNMHKYFKFNASIDKKRKFDLKIFIQIQQRLANARERFKSNPVSLREIATGKAIIYMRTPRWEMNGDNRNR